MAKVDLSGKRVPADDLTWREQEILLLLSERLSNREIADRLHLAETTVKDYVSKILSKLYVKNRRQAVERANELGLLVKADKSTAKPQVNLPTARTPFVGRSEELAEIEDLLARARLLTLTGPGGIGKTRLAVKAAERASGDFKDGCYFVPLAPINSVEHIIQTIAESINFPLSTQEDPQRQLLRYLQNKEILLVIDNFEHLLGGVEIVSDILQAAPEVKALAASRERLNLQSETIYKIEGMGFSQIDGEEVEADSDALILFVQSARKVRPGFEATPDQLDQIENICQIVDGMPLAIELAAAWLHLLSVAEILAELEQGLDILVADTRDAPERHRSIRAVFEYSWLLLEQDEQETFKKLSVFRGGFTRDAAQQLAAASLSLLAGLVNKSFLSHDPASGRLEIHELLRQYAMEQLGESSAANVAAQHAHVSYYAEFLEHRKNLLRGPQQMTALVEIEADIENIRAAWRYALAEKNASIIWKMSFGLWHLCWIRWWNLAGMELFAAAAGALEGEEDSQAVAARALAISLQAYFMAWLGVPEQGFELAEQAVIILEKFDHPEALILAYDSLTVNAYMMNRYSKYVFTIEKLMKIAARLDKQWMYAFALFAVGMGALVTGDYQKATALAEENLVLYQELGDTIGSTTPLIVLGHADLARGDLKGARDSYLRCLEFAEQVGFHYSTQTATKYLGKVAVSLGRIEEAEKYLHQSLLISKEIGFYRDIIRLTYEFARLLTVQGKTERAVELLSLILDHPASDQVRWLEGKLRDNIRELLAKLESELAPEVFTAAMKRGKGLDLDETVANLLGC
ncbi:MAG: LuxR C-terminal-related transcriptional regulator [Chloroflexota bacterium]